MSGLRRVRTVVLRLSRLEAHHLSELVTQFTDLLALSDGGRGTDPALARLVPDAYRDDPAAALDFREITAAGLLDRRAQDAGTVLASLSDAAETTAADVDADAPYPVELDPEHVDAWLRTLAALRLVLASRLGIDADDDDDHAQGDPRFGIYDWIGFRLDGLVRAATG